VSELNPAEQRFTAYLTEHGYRWQHEPDYQIELGLAERPETNPDFLIERNGGRAVAEVRQFETTALQDRLSKSGRAGVLAPQQLFGPQRFAMFEKAEQLRPLAGAGVPLLVVLANPLDKLVMLDDFHVQAAMWGNPNYVIPIDTTTGGPAEGHESYFRLEDYGAFASPVMEGGEVVAWENRHSHVTAVVVLHERSYSDDWREEILARYRAPDRSIPAAIDATLEALSEIQARSERGEEPEGVYQWVSVYEVNGDQAVPLPGDWFNGPRDERYGHTGDGYGRLWPESSEARE
jgi:hypothetical protein